MAVTEPEALRSAGSRPDLMDPRLLFDPRRMEFVARAVVEGFLIGLHRSPHRGFSVEFAENRPYYPGDDIRFLDWRMYARSDRWYLKQFEEETNLRACLVLDASRSMDWTSDPARRVRKLDYARLLAASLSNLLLRQGDATGLVAFDDRIRVHVAPRASRGHLAMLMRELVQLQGGGASEAGTAIRDVSIRQRRRGLILLMSDLLVDTEATRRALQYLRHRGHEVVVFHIMDPGELRLPASGEAVFFDPESGEELRTSSAALRGEYAAAVDAAISDWRRECRRMGADYHLLTTDTPMNAGLGRYLEKRARLA